MARFAQIDKDSRAVINVIVAEPGSDYFATDYALGFEWVAIDDAQPMPWIGWSYADGVFSEPA